MNQKIVTELGFTLISQAGFFEKAEFRSVNEHFEKELNEDDECEGWFGVVLKKHYHGC